MASQRYADRSLMIMRSAAILLVMFSPLHSHVNSNRLVDEKKNKTSSVNKSTDIESNVFLRPTNVYVVHVCVIAVVSTKKSCPSVEI